MDSLCCCWLPCNHCSNLTIKNLVKYLNYRPVSWAFKCTVHAFVISRIKGIVNRFYNCGPRNHLQLGNKGYFKCFFISSNIRSNTVNFRVLRIGPKWSAINSNQSCGDLMINNSYFFSLNIVTAKNDPKKKKY